MDAPAEQNAPPHPEKMDRQVDMYSARNIKQEQKQNNDGE